MKHLHAAIQANLRLMSLKDAAARRKSNDFSLCLDMFNYASSKISDPETFQAVMNTEWSITENVSKMLNGEQKLRSNDIVLEGPYLPQKSSSCLHNQCSSQMDVCPSSLETSELMKKSIASAQVKEHSSAETLLKNEWVKQEISKYLHCPMFCITAAYKANFYFTALQCYDLVLAVCEQSFEEMNKLKNLFDDPKLIVKQIPFLVSTSLSPIYDEHVQVILGFSTLHKFLSSTQSNSRSCHRVCLNMFAVEFLKYLHIQCERKLFGNFSPIEYKFPKSFDYSSPAMSQLTEVGLFSKIVLYAALRQSGANVQLRSRSFR
jgi:hypothetical protein